MKVVPICVAFIAMLSGVCSFIREGFGHRVVNAAQPRSCGLKLRKQWINSRPIAAETIFPRIDCLKSDAPSILSKLSLLAYDTAYAVNKENLLGKFKDHKYFRYLYYDFDADESYQVFGILFLIFIIFRARWIAESLLGVFGLRTNNKDLEAFTAIVNAWYQFTGAKKTDGEKKNQLLNALTEADVVNKRPTTQTFECEKCHMQLMPAKGRASYIMGKPTFRCARCGAKAASYFDIHDMDDERAVRRKERIENEALGLDDDGNELNY